MAGTCLFPGCTAPTATQQKNSNWCGHHRTAMNSSRRLRRIGEEAKKIALEGSYAHSPRAPALPNPLGSDAPHRVSIKCQECFGMPWARTTDRRNGRGGGGDNLGPSVANENGLCRGCGMPWEPEPAPELCCGVRSSAAMAIDHGLIDGHNRVYSGRDADGKRKTSK